MSEPVAGNITKAMFEVQKAMPTMSKDGEAKAGSFSYKFSTLPKIMKTLTPLFAEHGLLVTHSLTMIEDRVVLVTSIIHVESGEAVESVLPMAIDSNPQNFGKLMSYYRRYALCGLLGITSEDDTDAVELSRPNTQATAVHRSPNTSAQSSLPNYAPGAGGSGRDYVFPKGKHAGQTLGQVGYDKVKDLVNFYTDDGAKEAKGWCKDVVQNFALMQGPAYMEPQFDPGDTPNF